MATKLPAVEVSQDIPILSLQPLNKKEDAIITLEGPVSREMVDLIKEVGRIEFSMRSRIARMGFDIEVLQNSFEVLYKKGGVYPIRVSGRLFKAIENDAIRGKPITQFFGPGMLFGRFLAVNTSKKIKNGELKLYQEDRHIRLPDNAILNDDDGSDEEGSDGDVIIPLLPEKHVLTPEGTEHVHDILEGRVTRKEIMRKYQHARPIDRTKFSLSPWEGMIGAIRLSFLQEVVAVIQDNGYVHHSNSRFLDKFTGPTQESSDTVVEVRNRSFKKLDAKDLTVKVHFFPAPRKS